MGISFGASQSRCPCAKARVHEQFSRLKVGVIILDEGRWRREKNPKLTFSVCCCANARIPAKHFGGETGAFHEWPCTRSARHQLPKSALSAPAVINPRETEPFRWIRAGQGRAYEPRTTAVAII